MREKFGVHVYKVFAGKVGNSNCGNTSRIVFSRAEEFADLIGAPRDLIVDLGDMINSMNSKRGISSEKLEDLSKDWLKRFDKSPIGWNWLNASIHGMIKHGYEMLDELPTPPGYWTEEGTEASNKFIRSRRLNHARKMKIDLNIR